jgi:hypothetical protein
MWSYDGVVMGAPYKYPYHRGPHQRALHLRWIEDSLWQQVRAASKYRNQTMVKWVTDILKLYLAGGMSRFVGTCEICRRRAALSAPVKVKKKNPAQQIRDKIAEEAGLKTKTKPDGNDEAESKPCPFHQLRYHPGCKKPDGTHNHGPWWPLERCEREECRRPGNARLENLRRMLAESPGLS